MPSELEIQWPDERIRLYAERAAKLTLRRPKKRSALFIRNSIRSYKASAAKFQNAARANYCDIEMYRDAIRYKDINTWRDFEYQAMRAIAAHQHLHASNSRKARQALDRVFELQRELLEYT